MTKQSAIKKLEKKGYKVTFSMQGKVLASKGNNSYMANSVNGLLKKIF